MLALISSWGFCRRNGLLCDGGCFACTGCTSSAASRIAQPVVGANEIKTSSSKHTDACGTTAHATPLPTGLKHIQRSHTQCTHVLQPSKPKGYHGMIKSPSSVPSAYYAIKNVLSLVLNVPQHNAVDAGMFDAEVLSLGVRHSRARRSKRKPSWTVSWTCGCSWHVAFPGDSWAKRHVPEASSSSKMRA